MSWVGFRLNAVSKPTGTGFICWLRWLGASIRFGSATRTFSGAVCSCLRKCHYHKSNRRRLLSGRPLVAAGNARPIATCKAIRCVTAARPTAGGSALQAFAELQFDLPGPGFGSNNFRLVWGWTKRPAAVACAKALVYINAVAGAPVAGTNHIIGSKASLPLVVGPIAALRAGGRSKACCQQWPIRRMLIGRPAAIRSTFAISSTGLNPCCFWT